MWLALDCRQGVGPSEMVGGGIMDMGKLGGGAVGSPEFVRGASPECVCMWVVTLLDMEAGGSPEVMYGRSDECVRMCVVTPGPKAGEVEDCISSC